MTSDPPGKRDHDNPHRHCRLACTHETVTLRAVTLEGAVKILSYGCAACGQAWEVSEPASKTVLIDREEFEY